MTFIHYSKQIAERIRCVLKEDGREFEFEKAEGVFTFTLPLNDCCIDELQYYIFVHDDRYILYAHPPFRADLTVRRNKWQLAMFLLKANYVLYDGSFQLNYRNGMIRYRIFHQCDDKIPSEENIREAIQAAAYAYETFGCGIAGILRCMMSAVYAFEVCQNEQLKVAFFGKDETATQKNDAATIEAVNAEYEDAETNDEIVAQLEDLFAAFHKPDDTDGNDTSELDSVDNVTVNESFDTHLFGE